MQVSTQVSVYTHTNHNNYLGHHAWFYILRQPQEYTTQYNYNLNNHYSYSGITMMSVLLFY